MVPMIVQVLSEDGVTDVPITPDTTCSDVVECCRDPGEDLCTLVQVWRGIERVLQDEDRPLEILQEWGPQQEEVKFLLRYTVLHQEERRSTRNGMKAQGVFGDSLPEGVELSLWELQEMATRQQEQIESQHQVLVAKEQRLRYLKHQEAKAHQVVAEKERLRRLKERVEAQELKLRKLRALRGQIDQERISNGNLTSDLDSIRALFNEKEKELSLAVAKVEELTRQLEEVKRSGRSRESKPPTSAALELDKLRRELLYRNKLKEQQNVQLNQQRDALSQRQEEVKSMDKRISELQDRLQRKRLLNQQLSKQLQSNSQPRTNKQGILINYPNGPRQNLNVAAVEPYLHVPNAYHQKGELIKHSTENDLQKDNRVIGGERTPKTNLDNNLEDKDNNNEYLPEFAGSKTDPKYQTLPSNTRFMGNYGKSINGEIKDPPRMPNHLNPRVYGQQQQQQQHQHQQPQPQPQPQQDQTLVTIRSQPVGGSSPCSSTSSLATSSSSSSLSNPSKLVKTADQQQTQGKPISSVAPTTIIAKPLRNVPPEKSSPIYQTSSMKIHPIQPQTLGSTPQGILREVKPEPSPLSPPLTASTPLATPETDTRTNNTINAINNNTHINASTTSKLPTAPLPVIPETKPALPPKPAVPVKPTPPPPPRQTPHNNPPSGDLQKIGYIEITAESLDQALGAVCVNSRVETKPVQSSPMIEEEKKPVEESADEPDHVVNMTFDASTITTPTPGTESKAQDVNLNHSGDQLSQPNSANRRRKGNLKVANGERTNKSIAAATANNSNNNGVVSRRVSFDPLALLLDASLEGELELVKKTATQVANPSAANDEGITALHNAICAGHLDIVSFLVEFGCDVNAQDSDGWTPLHCAASCNNLAMVKFLVEHGACIFATTLSDHETAAEKCEEDEEGFDGCSEYLYSIQEKLGILNNGVVYAVYDYTPHNPDELGFNEGEQLVVLRKGDEVEREWWWTKKGDHEGYTPRNLLGLYPRVKPQKSIND